MSLINTEAGKLHRVLAFRLCLDRLSRIRVIRIGTKANHQALVNGPTEGELSVLRAQVAEGRAALVQVQSGSTPEQVAQGQATVQQAKAALAVLQAGATKEQIGVVEAAVKEAQAALDQARVALLDVELKAPFAGTIAFMDLEEGQYAAPGMSVVTLADLSTLHLETDNLVETKAVKVIAGQPVKITVDALPGETFHGTVARLKPKSVTKSGDVTYTVVITLEQRDPRFLWGMTTSVKIGG